MALREEVIAAALSKLSGWEDVQDVPWFLYGTAGYSWRPSLREFCARCTNEYSRGLLWEGFALPEGAYARLTFQNFRMRAAGNHGDGRRQQEEEESKDPRVWVARCGSCCRLYWIACSGSGNYFRANVEPAAGDA